MLAAAVVIKMQLWQHAGCSKLALRLLLHDELCTSKNILRA